MKKIFFWLFKSEIEYLLRYQRDKCANEAMKYYLNSVWSQTENAQKLYNEVNSTPIIDF